MASIGWDDAELGRRLGVLGSTVKGWRVGRREAPRVVLPYLYRVEAGIAAAGPAPSDWSRGVSTAP